MGIAEGLGGPPALLLPGLTLRRLLRSGEPPTNEASTLLRSRLRSCDQGEGMFYFDPYWGVWVRRLLTLKGFSTRYLDISMTGADAHEERIRIHTTVGKDLTFFNNLPTEVIEKGVAELGAELFIKLYSFNYVKHHGLSSILRANQGASGGVPASEVAYDSGVVLDAEGLT